MYSLLFLAWISRRCQEAKKCNKPFGGLNVIIAGDIGQIKPCNEYSIMINDRSKLWVLEKEGLDLLDEFKVVINLTKN